LELIWIDICINSCCAYTGQYKNYVQCEYYKALRFQDTSANKNCISQCQMAYFSIKDKLIIQYQNPDHSKELRYCANYNHHNNFKIGDVFNGKRYRELLSYGFFNDKQDI
ncbi:7778_t:CDS:1, partial [Funneliformis caledonium]